jgi:hypothetical protein
MLSSPPWRDWFGSASIYLLNKVHGFLPQVADHVDPIITDEHIGKFPDFRDRIFLLKIGESTIKKTGE